MTNKTLNFGCFAIWQRRIE